jgi:aminomethyltransferase
MKQTKFIDVHKEFGAKLVEFAGFEMPVQYSSIIAEHKAVRESVGVFDVSHMGEIIIKGEKALEFVQYITVNNAAKLEVGKVQYSAMCYKDGGIVDDLLVYKISDTEYMLVVNGANKDKDFNWMNENNTFGVDIIDESDDYSLLAVQGPNSQKVIEKLLGKEIDIAYYHYFNSQIFGIDVIVSRTGYTGELGFELYFKSNKEIAEKIWQAIFEAGKNFNITACGLGCRDTLRLEKGFCLYGNDIDETTTPLEAGLGWITKLKKGEFIGRDVLLEQKEKGVSRKLVPLTFEQKAFPRHNYEIKANGEKVGHITSGTVSPILEKPIALGYVATEHANVEETVQVVIRNKEVEAKITKLPFV